jgi:branched-chain amino acid aminotransferase
MFLNINSEIIESGKAALSTNNRAFKYGDAVFDTLKSYKNNIFFIEDHYFRLMSSMRMLRMEIPGNFTMEFYSEQIKRTLEANDVDAYGRIRFTVFRKDGGLFNPKSHKTEFVVEASQLETVRKETYTIELFKDFYTGSGQLSNIKTNNRILNVVAGIFADENGYDNCILLNERKNVAEMINANIFMVKDGIITTPPLSEGCINGIIRKNIISYLRDTKIFKIEESVIAPIELLQADEIFITNSVTGIQNVTKYRKRNYGNKVSKVLVSILEKAERS